MLVDKPFYGFPIDKRADLIEEFGLYISGWRMTNRVGQSGAILSMHGSKLVRMLAKSNFSNRSFLSKVSSSRATVLNLCANKLLDIYPEANIAENRLGRTFVYSWRTLQCGINGRYLFGRLSLNF